MGHVRVKFSSPRIAIYAIFRFNETFLLICLLFLTRTRSRRPRGTGQTLPKGRKDWKKFFFSNLNIVLRAPLVPPFNWNISNKILRCVANGRFIWEMYTSFWTITIVADVERSPLFEVFSHSPKYAFYSTRKFFFHIIRYPTLQSCPKKLGRAYTIFSWHATKTSVNIVGQIFVNVAYAKHLKEDLPLKNSSGAELC